MWSNGQTGLTATNLAAGVYLATATDAHGCIGVKTVTIDADVQLPAINIDLSADLQVDCGSPLVDLDNGTNTGTRDDAITVDDLLYFLSHFEAGC